jgi:hypothetical protein
VISVELLQSLPDRGWTLIRGQQLALATLLCADLIKVNVTPVPGTYEVRLTGAGRAHLQKSRGSSHPG